MSCLSHGAAACSGAQMHWLTPAWLLPACSITRWHPPKHPSSCIVSFTRAPLLLLTVSSVYPRSMQVPTYPPSWPSETDWRAAAAAAWRMCWATCSGAEGAAACWVLALQSTCTCCQSAAAPTAACSLASQLRCSDDVWYPSVRARPPIHPVLDRPPHPPCSFLPCSAGVMVSAGFCHLLGEALRAMPQIRVGTAGDWWVLLGKQRVGMWQCRSPAMAAAWHAAAPGGCWPGGCLHVWTGDGLDVAFLGRAPYSRGRIGSRVPTTRLLRCSPPTPGPPCPVPSTLPQFPLATFLCGTGYMLTLVSRLAVATVFGCNQLHCLQLDRKRMRVGPGVGVNHCIRRALPRCRWQIKWLPRQQAATAAAAMHTAWAPSRGLRQTAAAQWRCWQVG